MYLNISRYLGLSFNFFFFLIKNVTYFLLIFLQVVRNAIVTLLTQLRSKSIKVIIFLALLLNNYFTFLYFRINALCIISLVFFHIFEYLRVTNWCVFAYFLCLLHNYMRKVRIASFRNR